MMKNNIKYASCVEIRITFYLLFLLLFVNLSLIAKYGAGTMMDRLIAFGLF